MKAKMLNQLYQRGKERSELKAFERKSSRELDKDIWSTVYITDMPIQTLTETAYSKIDAFLKEILIDSEIKDFAIERNGMLGFWQFTVMTYKEVTKFDITDELDEQIQEQYKKIAYRWLEQYGYDKYGDDISITKLSFKKDFIEITISNENSGSTVILKKLSGEWKIIEY